MHYSCCPVLDTLYRLFLFRLAFSKDTVVSTTAGATVRHLVSAVFDRALVVTLSHHQPQQQMYSPHHLGKGVSPNGKGN